MKPRYILATYDNIIFQIFNPQQRLEKKIIELLKNANPDCYLIHKVTICKTKKEISFTFSESIHCLHPNAPYFEEYKSEQLHEIEEYIPIILDKIKLQNHQITYHLVKNKEKTIVYILESNNLEDCNPEHLFFYYCIQVLKTENQKIIKHTKQKIFNCKSKNQIKEYIHKKQVVIDNLTRQLLKQIQPNDYKELYQFSSDGSTKDCLRAAYIYLENLHQFLETEYREYLNKNGWVPLKTIQQEALKMAPKLAVVNSFLTSKNVNKNLFSTTFDLLFKISNHKILDKLNYKNFYFCCYLLTSLHFQIINNNLLLSNDLLCEWLYVYNINSLTCFDFITDKITAQTNLFETNKEKLDFLYIQLKIFNQKNLKMNSCFKEGFPSTKVQLTSWIKDEIEYLSRNLTLETNTLTKVETKENKNKMDTDLSVAQLSYIFSLFGESGIIKNPNNQDLFRFISENLKTKHTSQISLDSLSTKFYSVESTTKEAVRVKIIELLNLAKL